MKRFSWAERACGDTFLVASTSLLAAGIRAAELVLHPDYPGSSFVPTHGGVVWTPDTVVEAGMGLGQDSVALVHKASEYDGADIEIWRPESTVDLAPAVELYIAQFSYMKYGLANLFGEEWIAIVKEFTGRDIQNPIELSFYCTQGCMEFLGTQVAPLTKPTQDWAAEMVQENTGLKSLDPLQLRITFMQHQG